MENSDLFNIVIVFFILLLIMGNADDRPYPKNAWFVIPVLVYRGFLLLMYVTVIVISISVTCYVFFKICSASYHFLVNWLNSFPRIIS